LQLVFTLMLLFFPVMKKLFLVVALILPNLLFSQNIWHDVSESSIPLIGERRIVPRVYRTVKFELNDLQPLLEAAPLRFSPFPQSVQSVQSVSKPRVAVGGAALKFLLRKRAAFHPCRQGRVCRLASSASTCSCWDILNHHKRFIRYIRN